MKKIYLILLLLFSFLSANITDTFPKLTGRIVDEVNLLSSETKDKLNTILKQEEDKTSNQIVIVILKSLNGYNIEEYSYQLGRHWGIGQKDKNNGVLIVVSLNDKKIRIEVGYGLEGALTDKISHEIIEYTIKPYFKKKQYNKGVEKAIEKIIQAIKGEYINEKKESSSNTQNISLFLFAMIFTSMLMIILSSKGENLLFYKISKSSLLSSFFSLFTYIITSDFTKYGLIISFVVFVIVFIFNFITTKKIEKAKGTNGTYISTNDFDSFDDFNSFGSSSFSSSSFSGGGGSFGGGGASGSW